MTSGSVQALIEQVGFTSYCRRHRQDGANETCMADMVAHELHRERAGAVQESSIDKKHEIDNERGK